MPAFEYQALDATGRTLRGVMQADTARAARGSLRERGLTPLQIEAAGDTRRNRGLLRERGMGSAQLALFMRQLATLVASGLPMDDALQALVEGSEGRLRSQVVELRTRVMEGAGLAQAMGESPETFPTLIRASIGAGESAGKLDRVLLRLADYSEARDALRRRILLALTYPILLSLVALAVVSGLMIWVVPQVIEVFTQQQYALPWPTRVLISLTTFARDHGATSAALLLIAAVVGWMLLRQPRAMAAMHRLLLRVPLLGRLVLASETVRYTRTLSLLVGSAVPLLEALGIANQVVANQALRSALSRAAVRVREGQAFSRALAESGRFPPVAIRLIASGESSGRLDEMLGEAAAHQERELDMALGLAMAALGPGVILAVGGMVLFIVLAILLPIFELNTLIR